MCVKCTALKHRTDRVMFVFFMQYHNSYILLAERQVYGWHSKIKFYLVFGLQFALFCQKNMLKNTML